MLNNFFQSMNNTVDAFVKHLGPGAHPSGKEGVWWVTDDESQRFSNNAPGWSIRASEATEIIESGADVQDAEDFFDEDDEEE